MATPTYSSQLNLIEILWRFMKYEWIETQAYTSWKHLTQYIEVSRAVARFLADKSLFFALQMDSIN